MVATRSVTAVLPCSKFADDAAAATQEDGVAAMPAPSQPAGPLSDRQASAVAASITSLIGTPSSAPEDVVARSGLDASTVTNFLFENYLDFISDDAIADAALAAANFSDATHMIRQHCHAVGGGAPRPLSCRCSAWTPHALDD